MRRQQKLPDDFWGCPICGEVIDYGEQHDHAFVPIEERVPPSTIIPWRRCRGCRRRQSVEKMGYVGKPADGERPFWMCRRCRRTSTDK